MEESKQQQQTPAEGGVMVGGLHDAAGQNSAEFEELARFAVEDHNKKANAPALEFVRVLKVKEKVVAGTMYYIALEAKEEMSGEKKLYEAQIWVQLWKHFKEVQEFKQIQSVEELAAAA